MPDRRIGTDVFAMTEGCPREDSEKYEDNTGSVKQRDHLPGRTLTRRIGLLFILLGIGVLLYPVFTYIQAVRGQQELEQQWEQAAINVETAPLPALGGAKPPMSLHRYAGFPPTRLSIPKIGLDAIVVEGTSSAALKCGPGHFENTAMPGASGNCCIAGHRNIYGWWFYKLDRLSPGDSIVLSTPDSDFRYRVKRKFAVPPENTSVLGPTPGRALTLITCTPVPRPMKRLIVTAELDEDRYDPDSNSAVF